MSKHLTKIGTTIIMLVLLLLTATLFWSQSPQPVYGNDNLTTPQLAIKLTGEGNIDTLNGLYGTSIVKQLANQIYVIQLPAGADTNQMRQDLTNDPSVLYIESSQLGHAPEADGVDVWAWPANDPHAAPRDAFDWSLIEDQNTNRSSPHLNQPSLNLNTAHLYHDGAGITVAILDTGLDYTHQDLIPVISTLAYDFIDNDLYPADEFDGLDNDGDGYIDEVAGHGTHVAGIIHTVAPQAQLMPLRVLNSDGVGDSFIIAEAIWYAIEQGADVINLSLGTLSPSALLQDALDTAVAEGVIVVAAAGNTGRDTPQFPAASPCAIAVTAVNKGRVREPYANYGTWVNLSAPGKRILSAYPSNNYAWWSGTSMATPLVAGQVALLKGYDSTLTLTQVGNLISATAISLDARNQRYEGLLGQGQIDIGASLTLLATEAIPTGTSPLLPNCTP